jgi:hypothetical protein
VGQSPQHQGQALVEFALVIGVAILLIVGAIQSLHTFFLTRQVRAAAEEITDWAAVYGGDSDLVRQRAYDEEDGILVQHRLDPDLAVLLIEPAAAGYLDPITVTLTYNATVRFYGLFELPIPAQRVLRLSEGG